jgi:hypothetical protein
MSMGSAGKGKKFLMAVIVMAFGLFLVALFGWWVLWKFLAWPLVSILGFEFLIFGVPFACMFSIFDIRKVAVFCFMLAVVGVLLVAYGFGVLHP